MAAAYTNISAATLAAYLGVDADEALAVALSAGWGQDGDFVVPRPPAQRKQQQTELAQLEQLTSYLVFLERKT